jgi:hypothetical protein
MVLPRPLSPEALPISAPRIQTHGRQLTNCSLEHITKELKTQLTLYAPEQRDRRASSRIDLYLPETPLRTDSKCVVDVIRQHTCSLAASAQSLAVSSQISKGMLVSSRREGSCWPRW